MKLKQKEQAEQAQQKEQAADLSRPEKKTFVFRDLRAEVFFPVFILILLAAAVGVAAPDLLLSFTKKFFDWSLQSFGWLYQWLSVIALFIVGIIAFSRIGAVRLGGKDAKPGYSFGKWFAMALTGGIAAGIVTWGVNEPLVYMGNVYGELNQLGIKPNTHEAAIFAMGRCFYNWSFVPYAMYGISGIVAAYLYFNKKKNLSVASTLEPLFGKRVEKKAVAAVIDVLAALGILLGLTAGLGTCLTLVISGLKTAYGVDGSLIWWIGIGALTTFLFTLSSYTGLNKGIQLLADWNAKFYYLLLALLLITGPIVYILRISTAGMATWLNNFFLWGLDPIDIGGAALTQSWTLFDWAVWVAYAPFMGLYLAMISYGRTIRQFIIINVLLPSFFGIIWFSIMGGTALYWQETGRLDIVAVLQTNGAVAGLWAFMEHLPFHMGTVVIPFMLLIIIVSYATAAQSTISAISGLCIKNSTVGSEGPGYQRLLWGVLLGIIAIVMGAFGGGEQGVEGLKQLSSVAGFAALFLLILQAVSAVKMFFCDKLVE